MEHAEYERRAQCDLEDPQSAINSLVSSARIKGPNVLLEVLSDLERWDKAPRWVQDLAVYEVARRLGPKWKLLGVRFWTATKQEVIDCPDCTVPKSPLWYEKPKGRCSRCNFNRRIVHLRPLSSGRFGLFRHLGNNFEFSLLPGRIATSTGQPALAPFLCSRWAAGECFPETSYSYKKVLRWCRLSGLRLPSPEEWDHAARAGAKTRFYFGDDLDEYHIWDSHTSWAACQFCDDGLHSYELPSGEWRHDYSNCRAENFAQALDEHEQERRWNRFGLVDLWGNVWEWTSKKNAQGLIQVKGACFMSEKSDFFENEHFVEGRAAETVGFRPVCSIPDR